MTEIATTEEIRVGYTQWSITDEGAAAAGEEFDAWLAAHDQEIAARALEEAANALGPESWRRNESGNVQVLWLRERARQLRMSALPTEES